MIPSRHAILNQVSFAEFLLLDTLSLSLSLHGHHWGVNFCLGVHMCLSEVLRIKLVYFELLHHHCHQIMYVINFFVVHKG